MSNIGLSFRVTLSARIVAVFCTFLGCAGLPQKFQVAKPLTKTTDTSTWSRIGSFSTTFDLSEGERSHNIEQAVERLNGAIIPPSSTFSFNHVVGPRTIARGFRVAPVLMLEGARPALGGGICQVSTTLYNTALYAGLRVAERYAHSRPIRYVPLGRDATVSWGSKDLRIENPNSHPVQFRAFTRNGRLFVDAYAPHGLGYEVRLETADHEEATPRKKLQVLAQPDRLSVGGVWVKLYRHKVIDGSVIATERIGLPTYYPFAREVTAQ